MRRYGCLIPLAMLVVVVALGWLAMRWSYERTGCVPLGKGGQWICSHP